MIRYDAGTTNPTLLNRLCDWRDHEAWVDFVTRYDPVIRLSCRRYRLSAENADELSQRVWIDLARRMRTFRYDPGKTFRGWLRRLCQSRATDLLRKKNADDVLLIKNEIVHARTAWNWAVKMGIVARRFPNRGLRDRLPCISYRRSTIGAPAGPRGRPRLRGHPSRFTKKKRAKGKSTPRRVPLSPLVSFVHPRGEICGACSRGGASQRN